MAEIQYTGTQNEVRTAPTNYNVQPNQTAARGFANVSKILQGGVQLKVMQNENEYRQQLIKQEQEFNTFSEQIKGKTFGEQKGLFENFSRKHQNTWVAGEDKYSQDLNARYNKFSSATKGSFAEAQQRVDHNSAVIGQSLAGTNTFRVMSEAKNTAESREQLDLFKEDYVDRFKDSNDPLQQALYSKGLDAFDKLNTLYLGQVARESDNEVYTETLAAITTFVEEDGGILSPENYGSIKEIITGLSTFKAQKGAHLDEVDRIIGNQIVSYAANPDIPPSFEKSANMQKAVDQFLKLSPNIAGKGWFHEIQNAATKVKNTVHAQDRQNRIADLQNFNVPITKLTADLEVSVAEGVFSKEEAANILAQKSEQIYERGMRQQIMAYLNDEDGLTELVGRIEDGSLSPSMVSTQIKAASELIFADISAQHGDQAAAGYVLQDYKKYTESGIDVGRIDAIDIILDSPRTEQVTTESISKFLSTYKAALAAGYPIKKAGQQDDYNVLQVGRILGISDLPTVFSAYKDSPVHVNSKEVTAKVNELITHNQRTEDLSPINAYRMTAFITPLVNTLMKSGLDVDEAYKRVREVFDSQYIRVDTNWGGDGEVLIPTTSAISTEETYLKLHKKLKTAFKDFDGVDYFGPQFPTEPEGTWEIIAGDGSTELIPFAVVTEAAKTLDIVGALNKYLADK